MTEFYKRLLSSVVLIPIALVCLWYGGWAYGVLVLVTMVGMVWEGATLFGQPMRSYRGCLLLVWPVCAGVVAIEKQWISLIYMAVAALCFGVRLWATILIALLGGVSLLYLRSRPDGLYETLFVMAVVVASDSGAYIVGRLIGGPKLAPAISPGKTISGSVGGLISAALMGGFVAFEAHAQSYSLAFLWGGVLGAAAQCGDLAESAFKRRLGVKDSGTLIPGHGGLFDRLDGLLLAAPLAAAIALLCHHKSLWMLGLH